MEDRVFSELEKQKEILSGILKVKYGLSEEDFDHTFSILAESLQSMIKLMKEGKSAHEKFFSDIILNSIDAIIGFDNDNKIFLWNKGAEKMFGYSQQEAAGKGYALLIPRNLLEKGEVEFLIKQLKESGFLPNYETERITKSGAVLNVSIARFTIHDVLGNTIGSVGIIRDITTVKKLQQELREKENLALIGEVVSSIAHSFSNPLNIISGNADYLLQDKKPGTEGYEEMKIILEESARITHSIRQLLNLSRPFKIEKTLNDLNKIIGDVIQNSKHLFGEKKITIKKSLEENLGEFLFGKNEIQEVLSNIVANAIQAIPDEGEIKIKSYKSNQMVNIDIKDNGTGISKENLEKIFMPFYSSKAYGKGTGLGLSIVNRIIKEHGGKINVKSLPGKGTTFTISLPEE